MSLAGSCPVVVPSHRLAGGGPHPTGHPSREREADALRAAVDLVSLAGSCPVVGVSS